MSLSEVLEQVRAATGPDQALDLRIARALGLWDVSMPGYEFLIVREYTGSIDAAVGLVERVLPGFAWSYHPEAGAAVWDNDFLGPVRSGRGDAETPALALIAAMLEAKIAEDA